MRIKFIIQMFSSILLISCSSSSSDIKKFIEDTKKSKVSSVKPVPHLKEYEQMVYSAAKLRDPFYLPVSNITLKVNTPTEKVKIKQKRPDFDRQKEYLESMPLDSLIMVGTIQKKGDMWALIVDKTGIIHKVKEGNYLGENSGKIQKITEDSIAIDEIMSDEQGGWVHRDAALNVSNKQQN